MLTRMLPSQAAKKEIKVWNQIEGTPNPATGGSGNEYATSIRDSSGAIIVTYNNPNWSGNNWCGADSQATFIIGHTYYVSMDVDCPLEGMSYGFSGRGETFSVQLSGKQHISKIYPNVSVAYHGYYIKALTYGGFLPAGTVIKLSNFQCFDLTLMFGAGKEPRTVEEFESIVDTNVIYPYCASREVQEWNQLKHYFDEKNSLNQFYWTTTRVASSTRGKNIFSFVASAKTGEVHEYGIISYPRKFYCSVEVKTTSPTSLVRLSTPYFANGVWNQNNKYTVETTFWQKLSNIINVSHAEIQDDILQFRICDERTSAWDSVSIKNAQLIDLTRMFGAGNEPTTVQEVEVFTQGKYIPYTG